MKALIYTLFFTALSIETQVALAQHVSVDGNYYQTIAKSRLLEEDRSNLFLALRVADLRREPGQTEDAKARSLTLSEFCQKSIEDTSFYIKNKETITELVNSIFLLQSPMFEEKFTLQITNDYNRARHEKYLKTLTEFKLTNSTDSAQALLNDIEHELVESRGKDSIEFISLMVNGNLNSFVEGIAARLEKSGSIDEVNRLFELTNSLIEKDYNPELEREITFKISEALKPGFQNTQNSLGDLLLQGYGKHLAKRGKIAANPTQNDVREVYEYVISSSNQISLNRNILLAQANLLERGILTCNTMNVAKVQRGWSWASNDDRLNIIPFVMLNKSKDEIVQQSKSGQGEVEIKSDYYTQREKSIELFNYKFDKFSGLSRISRGKRPLIFDDQLLKLGEGQYYNGCKLIHYITRDGFYKFPN